MHPADTIAALATGLAPAGRAMVRISGPRVGSVIAALLRGVPEHRGGGPAIVLLPSGPLPVLALRGVATRTYTGEDTLEIWMAGHAALAQRVLQEILNVPGVRHAVAGEFTARAYLHGRLTLAQAEGVAALIAAVGAGEAEAARSVLRGRRGVLYEGWSERIAHLLALVEAGIDFSDQEDVVAITPGTLQAALCGLLDELDQAGAASLGSEAVTAQARVVLAGPPSTGKSTLFNALLGRSRAMVHASPGTTRDALVEPLTLHDDPRGPINVLLIDLPGVDREATVPSSPAAGAARARGDSVTARAGEPPRGAPLEQAAQRAAREEIERATIVLACEPAGTAHAEPLLGRASAVVRVHTKSDRAPAAGAAGGADPHACAAHDGREAPLRVCALNGAGLPALRRAIAAAAWSAGERAAPHPAAGTLLPRHRAALVAVACALQEARVLCAGDALPAELLADRLRAALDALGELTGRVERDEILGRVFATFCIGK